MQFKHSDGGRSQYFKGTAGDCVTRAIAIADGIGLQARLRHTLSSTIPVGEYLTLKSCSEGQKTRPDLS